MPSRLLKIFLGATLAFAPALGREPANLDVLKGEIRAYLDSGEYDRETAAVAAQAGEWLEQRVKRGGAHLAIVFDLDETLFSNLPLIRGQDFAYNAVTWNAWVADGKAPAIPAVRDLYLRARALKVEIIFITGRHERHRAGTEKNLRAIGCGDYTRLILKPDGSSETTGAFKLAARRRLESEGHVIIANIGDQDSDLEGGVAERGFKLPDPFYLTK
ncbi:MAG: acid phosphatase [Verrucomicrobia bacterium]|nr:acid phosphatase [Verrucomicrobiota bacterium]